LHKPNYQTEMTPGIPDLCRGLTLLLTIPF
jgi:hypothetical protein